LYKAAAPLHQGAAVGHPRSRYPPQKGGDHPGRRGPKPAEAAERLPLPHPLPLCDRTLLAGDAAADRRGRQAQGCLPALSGNQQLEKRGGEQRCFISTSANIPICRISTTSNTAAAGGVLCCLGMVVENMTMHSFSLEECRQMVYDLKANMCAGSDLQIMGPAVAEKFGLTYDQTDDINKMLAHVHAGGMAVA